MEHKPDLHITLRWHPKHKYWYSPYYVDGERLTVSDVRPTTDGGFIILVDPTEKAAARDALIEQARQKKMSM